MTKTYDLPWRRYELQEPEQFVYKIMLSGKKLHVEFRVNWRKYESLWQWKTCIKDERFPFLSMFFRQYLEVKLDNTGSLFKFEIVDVKLVCKDFKNHGGWKVYKYEYNGEYYFITSLFCCNYLSKWWVEFEF